MKFLTFVWKLASSFDLQAPSSDQEQQYGCHDDALHPELFPLRDFINKHGEPLVTTRTIKFTTKFSTNINTDFLLFNIKHFFMTK